MSGRPSDEVWITNQLVNIAGVWQSGADIKVSYTYDTKSWGVLNGRVSGVYINEYVIQSLPTDAPFDYAARIPAPACIPVTGSTPSLAGPSRAGPPG